MRNINDAVWTFGDPEITKSSFTTVVDYFTFLIIKDYLYKGSFRKIKKDRINVSNALSINNFGDPCLRKISPEYQNEGIFSFNAQYSYFFIEYKETIYIINLIINVEPSQVDRAYHFVSVEGMENKANQSFELFFEIVNFSPNKKPFKYLLNGKPGTGKTQIISAVLNSTYKKITTVVLRGTDYNFNAIFDFCSTLSPCLLVIDDLDFIAEDRNKSGSNGKLNDLLHALDGIYSTSIFILGATNDKNLVDTAASRPGRFDLIIDFSFLSSENYVQLIKRETEDEEIINLFDGDILATISEKKVTGAFIVNLVKQIKSIKNIKKEVNRADLIDLISFSYDGFYALNEKG